VGIAHHNVLPLVGGAHPTLSLPFREKIDNAKQIRCNPRLNNALIGVENEFQASAESSSGVR